MSQVWELTPKLWLEIQLKAKGSSGLLKIWSYLSPSMGGFQEKPRFLTNIPNDLDTYSQITFGEGSAFNRD